MDETTLQRIRLEVARQSDALLEAAEEFIDGHDLISTKQAHGLLNVVNCKENINNVVTQYIQRQADKSTHNKAAFWNGLKREFNNLRRRAEEIQGGLDIRLEGEKAYRWVRDMIYLLLARDYVQHLVAHVIYKSPLPDGGEDDLA